MKKESDCKYRFFQNKSCEYFPCHEGIDDEHFNCLFCYCPLYLLGENCGGNYTYAASGRKDCSDCLIPHLAESFDMIEEKLLSLPCTKEMFKDGLK